MNLFILNLNIKLIKDKIKKTEKEFDFSCESLAILSLIDYCNLQFNVDFKCFCYYDSIETGDEYILEFLNKKYKNYKFLNGKFDYKTDKNIIFVKNTISCTSNVNDIKLPCIVKNINENLSLTITGLASVYREIVKESQKLYHNSETNFLLVFCLFLVLSVKSNLFMIYQIKGFRNNCLKACSEVSRWTYLCETMSVKVYDYLNDINLRATYFQKIEENLDKPLELANRNRKLNKERESILSNKKIRYMEDYFITIADLILFFFISLILNENKEIEKEMNKYKRIIEWYINMSNDSRIDKSFLCLNKFKTSTNFDLNNLEAISKSIELNFDKINLKDNLLNEEDDTKTELLINDIFSNFKENNVELLIKKDFNYNYKDIMIDWESIDKNVSPSAGNLPSNRIKRKCQQLENMLYLLDKCLLVNGNKEKKIIVDFCSGGGHLGILIAYMHSNCVVKLVENKEESLEFAIKRIKALKLKNCHLYKGNLTNFIGKFDVGIGLHACGSMTDLLIEKCLQSQADILLAPCCYGSIKENDQIKYPRSNLLTTLLLSTNNHILESYYKFCNYADRTEKNIEYEEMAYSCMNIIDTDRLIYLKEKNYIYLQLNKMKPEDCTTKNNLILAKFIK